MKNLKYIQIIFLIFILSSCTIDEQDDCNLLERYSQQHTHIEFIGCQHGEGQTIQYATYKVAGEHSFEVEKYLIENYGMGELKFVCCGWEPQSGKNGEIINSELMRLDKDYYLSVTMTGNAEKKNEQGSLYIETDRNKIDTFMITVSLLKV